MARTILTVRNVSRSGLNITTSLQAVAAANGATFRNTGAERLFIYNNSGWAATITVYIAKTVDGETVPPKTWTVNNNTSFIIPPFPNDIYNQTNEQVYIDTNQAVYMIIFKDDI